ncbi:hypothetical protein MPTK1_3g04990 [Marchantia polymorpha subsp. ruderalis]
MSMRRNRRGHAKRGPRTPRGHWPRGRKTTKSTVDVSRGRQIFWPSAHKRFECVHVFYGRTCSLPFPLCLCARASVRTSQPNQPPPPIPPSLSPSLPSLARLSHGSLSAHPIVVHWPSSSSSSSPLTELPSPRWSMPPLLPPSPTPFPLTPYPLALSPVPPSHLPLPLSP